jgi:cytochrome c-type biogenesis protein CcmE
VNQNQVKRSGRGQLKFIIGGLLIIGAIAYLVVTSLQSTAEYFYTVNEIRAKGPAVVGKSLRASGAVIGDSITFDAKTLKLTFTMANVSNDTKDITAAGGLAQLLHNAVLDPKASRMQVVYVGPKPDLLKNEAQAIVTGKLGADGVFYDDELLLKCPTRYDQQLPAQAQGSGS